MTLRKEASRWLGFYLEGQTGGVHNYIGFERYRVVSTQSVQPEKSP